MEKIQVYLLALLIVLVFGYFSTLNNENRFQMSGRATQVDAPSSASILSYFSISASPTLQSGVIWSSIQNLPVTDLDADGNNAAGSTAYSTQVSPDSNLQIDFCIKASGDLVSGVNVITLNNYRWDSALNAIDPVVGSSIPMTTSFVKTDLSINPGFSDYFRFWLSVPGSKPAGTYTNTITFKGVSAGNAC